MEILPISPTYPIKKSNKIIREREGQTDGQSSSEQKKNDDSSDKSSEQHIDEIV